MATTTAAPPPVGTTDHDQVVVLPRVSWETYERLLTDDEDRRVPRLSYDRGLLEIVSPSFPHERDAVTMSRIVDIVAAQLDVPVLSVGSMTYRRKHRERGFEADGGFYVQHEARMRGRTDLDPTVDPPPDIVIEMETSRSALDKLALFAALGVPEVWRCRGDQVAIYVLEGETYRPSATSRALAVLTADVLTSFLADSRTLPSPEWFRMVSRWAAEQRAHG
jgi:Uma2 family endonuclease